MAEGKYGRPSEIKVNSFLEMKKIDEAIAAYQKILEIAPGFRFLSKTLNLLCWRGSLTGNAEKVIECCDKALESDKENYSFRDSRGLARALTGDIQGAIKDFQFAVDHVDKSRETFKKQRQSWIRQLNADENPFTKEQLQKLSY